MKTSIITFIIGIAAGVYCGARCSNAYWEKVHEAAGIEKFEQYFIRTPSCDTNWFEVVWSKERYCAKKND